MKLKNIYSLTYRNTQNEYRWKLGQSGEINGDAAVELRIKVDVYFNRDYATATKAFEKPYV